MYLGIHVSLTFSFLVEMYLRWLEGRGGKWKIHCDEIIIWIRPKGSQTISFVIFEKQTHHGIQAWSHEHSYNCNYICQQEVMQDNNLYKSFNSLESHSFVDNTIANIFNSHRNRFNAFHNDIISTIVIHFGHTFHSQV